MTVIDAVEPEMRDPSEMRELSDKVGTIAWRRFVSMQPGVGDASPSGPWEKPEPLSYWAQPPFPSNPYGVKLPQYGEPRDDHFAGAPPTQTEPSTSRGRHERGHIWRKIGAFAVVAIVFALAGGAVGYQMATHNIEATAAAKALEVPDLIAIAQDTFGSAAEVRGDARAVTVTINGLAILTENDHLREYLKTLGFSEATFDRMNRTRALDGTQSADGKNCNATWTYHPDDGLQIVFEAVATP